VLILDQGFQVLKDDGQVLELVITSQWFQGKQDQLSRFWADHGR
jgi:hypothetical protein